MTDKRPKLVRCVCGVWWGAGRLGGGWPAVLAFDFWPTGSAMLTTVRFTNSTTSAEAIIFVLFSRHSKSVRLVLRRKVSFWRDSFALPCFMRKRSTFRERKENLRKFEFQRNCRDANAPIVLRFLPKIASLLLRRHLASEASRRDRRARLSFRNARVHGDWNQGKNVSPAKRSHFLSQQS